MGRLCTVCFFALTGSQQTELSCHRCSEMIHPAVFFYSVSCLFWHWSGIAEASHDFATVTLILSITGSPWPIFQERLLFPGMDQTWLFTCWLVQERTTVLAFTGSSVSTAKSSLYDWKKGKKPPAVMFHPSSQGYFTDLCKGNRGRSSSSCHPSSCSWGGGQFLS